MKFFEKCSSALVLCAHTDDELGCAGTIVRLLNNGYKVYYIALSRCEESVPQGLPKDVLEKECIAATRLLGLHSDNIFIKNYKVRHFPAFRQEILEFLVSFNKQHMPDMVFLPSSSDIHQDHSVVFHEGIRAFKYSSIFGYELPQNNISASHTAFVKLSKNEIDSKIIAMSEYKSQNFRPYSRKNFILGLATVRGLQCNAEYAEAFEVIRQIY